ncbi:SH2 domain-containing protein [Actinomyces howellii]|nr:hypothetical protein [Actinomyces howellii]
MSAILLTACVVVGSCSSVPWARQAPTPSPSPTALSDPYLCDIVSAEVLKTTLKFQAGHEYYLSHNRDEYDWWSCELVSPGLDQAVKIEYTDNDRWSTVMGDLSASSNGPVIENPDWRAESIGLPGHEGQGWYVTNASRREARILIWRYPDGYYLVISVRYKDGAPSPEDSTQAMQDLALTVVDKIPASFASDGGGMTAPDDGAT